jgi:hypothetical protein
MLSSSAHLAITDIIYVLKKISYEMICQLKLNLLIISGYLDENVFVQCYSDSGAIYSSHLHPIYDHLQIKKLELSFRISGVLDPVHRPKF